MKILQESDWHNFYVLPDMKVKRIKSLYHIIWRCNPLDTTYQQVDWRIDSKRQVSLYASPLSFIHPRPLR